jgi:hypothetical protein
MCTAAVNSSSGSTNTVGSLQQAQAGQLKVQERLYTFVLTLCSHCDDTPVGSPAAAGTGHAKDCAHAAVAAAVHVAAHAWPANSCAWLL